MELDKSTRDDLRVTCDYMMKEGSTILLFCSWQLLHVYNELFAEKKTLQHRGTAQKKGSPRTTHSKYKVSKDLLVFSKADSRVVMRPQAKDQPVSGGEFAMIITRMRSNEGGQTEFACRPEDLMLNIKDASEVN